MRPSVVVGLLGGALGAGAVLRSLAFLATVPLATLHGVAGGAPTLVYVFQRQDCPGFRELVEEWNDIHRRKLLPVVGVGLGFPGGRRGAQAAARTAGAAFPVRTDVAGRAERLALRLGYARTPLTLLLDAGGRPRLALPAPRDAEGRRRARELVLAAAGGTPARQAGAEAR